MPTCTASQIVMSSCRGWRILGKEDGELLFSTRVCPLQTYPTIHHNFAPQIFGYLLDLVGRGEAVLYVLVHAAIAGSLQQQGGQRARVRCGSERKRKQKA